MNMRIIKLSATFFAISLFLMACNADQTPQIANIDPNPNDGTLTEADQDDYWAKDNLDLQRVGSLLERSDSPEEFEAYLNEDDGINNLDLNGDGYVDYISVDEFEDRGPNERGLSLFSRFGPDLIQEIATIIFYRDDLNSPGSRILLTGNEQLYGDNYYYETNWLDRSLGLVTTLFSDRDQYYRSPYYYDNYPPDYVVYEVVQTPVYRTRIERIYPQPLFVYTAAAPVYLTKIKIKSPHKGKWMDKVYAKLAKPTKEQAEFKKNNPGRPEHIKLDKVDRPDKDAPGRGDAPGPKREDVSKPGKQPKEDRKPDAPKGNPSKPAKAENPSAKPPKPDNPAKGHDHGQGKPAGQGKGKKP
jgi:hypothetical protein